MEAHIASILISSDFFTGHFRKHCLLRKLPTETLYCRVQRKLFLGRFNATPLTMDVAFSTIELKDDTIIVVLGASGDLAKKKTVRAPPPTI